MIWKRMLQVLKKGIFGIIIHPKFFKCSDAIFFVCSVAGGISSEESAESSEEDVLAAGHRGSVVAAHQHSIRTPITTLLGHQGVVISCAWLNEDLAVTAGWDRYCHA